MKSSPGSALVSAFSTVSPPIPESNTPIGRSVADAAAIDLTRPLDAATVLAVFFFFVIWIGRLLPIVRRSRPAAVGLRQRLARGCLQVPCIDTRERRRRLFEIAPRGCDKASAGAE